LAKSSLSFHELLTSQGFCEEGHKPFDEMKQELYSSFQYDPVEDGYIHPAEKLLEAMLRYHRKEAKAWLSETILKPSKVTWAAFTLRCLARVEGDGDVQWRKELIKEALKHTDLELRDAAIQAIETWKNPELVPILRNHKETVAWLRDYAAEVVSELE
jgi:hypothetical protein